MNTTQTPTNCCLHPICSALIDALESMARQHCHTVKAKRDYNEQVAGTLVTDSGALSANAEALEELAARGRFRIVADGGRMVVGYWPENDPANTANDQAVPTEGAAKDS